MFEHSNVNYSLHELKKILGGISNLAKTLPPNARRISLEIQGAVDKGFDLLAIDRKTRTQLSDRADKVILIDDDPCVADLWRSLGISLEYFKSEDDFLKIESRFDRSVPVYVDWFLHPGIESDTFTEFLKKELKFKTVYAVSSMPCLNLSNFPWLNGLLDKQNPNAA